MPWKIQKIRGKDCRCIFCGMQRVVFHSSFPSLLARNSLLGLTSSKIFQLLRTSTSISDHDRKFSDDFRTLPKISEDFPKISKNYKIIWKTLLNSFRSFPKVSENVWTLPMIFRKLKKTHKIIWKTLLNRFRSFPEISEHSRFFPKILKRLLTISEVFQKVVKIANYFPKFS